MGKNTFESLPQPLKNRDNIVISTTMQTNKNKNVQVCDSWSYVKNVSQYDDVYIIGGEEIYMTGVISPYVSGIFHTVIKEDYDCDRYFPVIPNNFEKINIVKFKDIDKITNKNVYFDIELYINSEYDDSQLNYYKLNDNLMDAINKLKLNHNIVNYFD